MSKYIPKNYYWGIDLEPDFTAPKEFKNSRSKIMYIEDKSNGLVGDARIGRVFLSKTGKTLYYKGLTFQSLKGSGFKANFYEVNTGSEFWISAPRKDKNDKLYGGSQGVEIDEDVEHEYHEYIKRA